MFVERRLDIIFFVLVGSTLGGGAGLKKITFWKCCNLLNINQIACKSKIFWKEFGSENQFLALILTKNVLFFEKSQKWLVWPNSFQTSQQNYFWAKNAKICLIIILRQKSRDNFFFTLSCIFEILTKKEKKITFLAHFGQNFQKYKFRWKNEKFLKKCIFK